LADLAAGLLEAAVVVTVVADLFLEAVFALPADFAEAAGRLRVFVSAIDILLFDVA
jgi:Na+/H+-translocating membrane pyrophosphatase